MSCAATARTFSRTAAVIFSELRKAMLTVATETPAAVAICLMVVRPDMAE